MCVRFADPHRLLATLLTGSIRGERELSDVPDAHLRDAERHATAELGPARVTAGPNALRQSQERSIRRGLTGACRTAPAYSVRGNDPLRA